MDTIIRFLRWPHSAWSRWYWREVYRARHKLTEDVRRYGGHVWWPEDQR